MGNFVFRAAPEMVRGEDIKCKDPNSSRDVMHFIKNGSNDIKTRFISTSKYIGICKEKYSLGKREDNKIIEEKRTPIILIDLDKVPNKIHNFSQGKKDTNNTKNSDKSNKMILDRSKADREVIVEDSIPKEAYKEIPPILVDIIESFETTQRYSGYQIHMLCYSIFENEGKDFLEIINNIQFSELEHIFINEYYNKMRTINSINKEFCEKKYFEEFDKLAIETVKTNILYKIFTDKNFIDFFHKKQAYYFVTQTNISPITPEMFTDFDSFTSELYSVPEGSVTTTGKKQWDQKNSLVTYNGLCIPVKKDRVVYLPRYIDKEIIEKNKVKEFESVFFHLQSNKNKYSYPEIQYDVTQKPVCTSRKIVVSEELYKDKGLESRKKGLEDCMDDERATKTFLDNATREILYPRNKEKAIIDE